MCTVIQGKGYLTTTAVLAIEFKGTLTFGQHKNCCQYNL
jgi:hypothetical protein